MVTAHAHNKDVLLRALPYYGGKAYGGKARWIASLLPPPAPAQTYVEPFGGMASVLLAREKVASETLNDVNNRLINWWECVRDNAAELARLVRYTPISEVVFARAIADLDDMTLTPVRRALAFHIVVSQSIRSTDNALPSSWRLRKRPRRGTEWSQSRFDALADRMRLVQITCRPAIDVLREYAETESAVIYVDPPYPSADTSAYAHGEIDVDALTAALWDCRGFVAVSGCGNEWDHLGWERYSRSAVRLDVGGGASPRVENLWVNRKSPQRLF